MSKPSEYGALNTKLSVLKRKMLNVGDYEILIEKNSIKDMINVLKEKELYFEILKDLSVEDVHRGEFETRLRAQALKKMKEFKSYLPRRPLEFYNTMFMRYEVEDLKLILRTISRGDEIGEIQDKLLELGHKNIDYRKLEQSPNVEVFVETLKDTIYYYPLRSLTQEDMEAREFHMEMNLENVYFRELYKAAKSLGGIDRDIILDLLGTNIDLINLQFVYRAKKYYNISPEETLNYSIPGGKTLKYLMLKDLIYAPDVRAFLDKISKNRKYRTLFEDVGSDMDIDIRMSRQMNQMFHKYERQYPFTISGLIYFIHRLEYEIKDITTITESIRYKVESSYARALLIRNAL